MKPKKSLGQHFLTSHGVVRNIVAAARLTPSDTVLEIGPGRGVLTKALLARVKKVIAIEKDAELVARLKETFSEEIIRGTLTLVHDDILSYNVSKCIPKNTHFKLVANIPYYITGDILRHFLSSDNQPSTMVLLVQKEVAERIARSKKESILSLSVKAYGAPRYTKVVPARYFKPRPKVDSAILTIENISKKFFSGVPEETFFSLIKCGFAHKRKFLSSNIKHLFKKNGLPRALKACDIPEKTRAESVPLDTWRCLAAQKQFLKKQRR